MDQKLPGDRFPLSIIGHAVWLYHRYTLSDRDVEERLFERVIYVSRESIRNWCIQFSSEFVRWHLDEIHVLVGGVPTGCGEQWTNTEPCWMYSCGDIETPTQPRVFSSVCWVSMPFPETVCTDKLSSYGAAIRALPLLDGVDHQQVVSTARCNNSIEQSHRPTRGHERSQLGFRQVKRTQGVLALHARLSNLHGCSRSTAPAHDRRHRLSTALRSWKVVVQQVA
jgi:putative transposase